MRRLRDGLIALGIALAALAAAEGALRLAGFRRDIAPISLRFGYPNPREITDIFRPDPALFWRLRPGSVFDAEAPVPINAAGYRGPVPASPRPAGLVRVAVMGDSVAFGASTSFPEMLGDRLRGESGAAIEVLDYGVPGYSVVQGLRQFDAEVAATSPDVVVVAYGWNDHWLAHGGVGDEARRPARGALADVSLSVARLRIAQAMAAIVSRVAPAPSHTAAAAPDAPRRVPLDVYRARIGDLLAAARRAGSVPIVVALPSGLADGEFPGYLIDMGFAATRESAIADHRRYAEAAREAAAAAGAAFIELQPAFEEAGAVAPGLFRKDKIHMTDAGNARIADALTPEIVRVLASRSAGGTR